MSKPKEEKTYKYEYNHYDLGYGMHYGIHSYFGEHIALGVGSNMVHIYPYKIYIGDGEDNAIPLKAEHQRILKNIFKIMGGKIEASKVKAETYKGEMGEEDSNAPKG